MRARRLLMVTGVILAGGAVWLLLRSPAPPEPAPAALPPSMRLRETAIVLRQKGEKRVELRAGRVEISRDLRSLRLQEITRAAVFDHGGETARMRAEEIVLDRTTNDFVARGNLEIALTQGGRLSAPEARWASAQQRLVFPSGVRLSLDGSEVIARRLVVDTRLQVFELSGGVDVSFRVKRTSP